MEAAPRTTWVLPNTRTWTLSPGLPVLRYAQLNAQPPCHAPECHDALKHFNRLMKVCKQSAYSVNVHDYLSCWFCGADPATIRQDNLADLIAYGFWYKSRQDLEASGGGPLLYSCVERMLSTLRIAVPPGHTPGLQLMTHLWEPLRAAYRPLFVYGVIEVVALLCRTLLMLGMGGKSSCVYSDKTGSMMGMTVGVEEWQQRQRRQKRQAQPREQFQRRADDVGCGSACVQLREATTAASCDDHDSSVASGASEDRGSRGDSEISVPVLFLHGVGLGLLPYLNLLRCLRAAGLPVVALEYKHVSLRLCSIIPSADDIAAVVVGLMDRLELQQACVVAHSYGTFVASRMAQLYGARLQSLTLLDPVCFGMFLPSLLANFIYRPPRTDSFGNWFQDYIRAFVSRDLHCAAAMCRRFYWSELNLWPHDLPCRTLVVLGGADQLLHVGEVVEFLRHYAAKLMVHPHHSHAAFLMDAPWQQQLVADIRTMASSGVGIAGGREVQHPLSIQPPGPEDVLNGRSSEPAAAAANTDMSGPQRRITMVELQRLLRKQQLKDLDQLRLRHQGRLYPFSQQPEGGGISADRAVSHDDVVLVHGGPQTGARAVQRRYKGGGCERNVRGGDAARRTWYGSWSSQLYGSGVGGAGGSWFRARGDQEGPVGSTSLPPRLPAEGAYGIDVDTCTAELRRVTPMVGVCEEDVAAQVPDLRRYMPQSCVLAVTALDADEKCEAEAQSVASPTEGADTTIASAPLGTPSCTELRIMSETEMTTDSWDKQMVLQLDLAEIGVNHAVLVDR